MTAREELEKKLGIKPKNKPNVDTSKDRKQPSWNEQTLRADLKKNGFTEAQADAYIADAKKMGRI
jgi:hypothetical protein